MNRLIITKLDGRILTALMNDSRAVQLDLEDRQPSILGNIYIGKVKDVVKNINAAFVDIGNGITGYYSLDDNPVHHYASAVSGERKLRPGDEIIVQVSRDAVRTKDPVLTSALNFTGKYCVLIAGKEQISFSGKIKEASARHRLTELLEGQMDEEFGLIVRTNAAQAEEQTVLDELHRLKQQYADVMENGRFRTCFSLLYSAVPSYVGRLKDAYRGAMEEVVTDDGEIYETVQKYLETEQPEDAGKLRLYQDKLVSLAKLYSLEKHIKDALQKKVWLKSGGYLVVEPTEAMTVIDVNTGKYTGKKAMGETVLKINLEAAREIALQLRLRNLSGIVIVDFINMETAGDKAVLMKEFASCCARDPVKTTVVDMTKLNLVEVTRKKIRKPFYEQFYENIG